MRIEKFIMEAISTEPDLLKATEKINDETKRLLKIAYEAGRSEGMDSAASFEWGIKRKDVPFEAWLIELQDDLENERI